MLPAGNGASFEPPEKFTGRSGGMAACFLALHAPGSSTGNDHAQAGALTSAESVLGITWGLDRVLGDPGPRRSTGLRCSAHRLAPDDAVSGELLGVEHVFSWMWDNYAGLSDHCAAAQGPAEHPWPRLCEAGRLARNEVPVAETVCVDDMDVDRSLAEHTALRVRGLRPCITNEYAHNGPRVDGERTVGRLLDRLPGRT